MVQQDNQEIRVLQGLQEPQDLMVSLVLRVLREGQDR